MNIKGKIHTQSVIWRLAMREGVSPETIRESMQEALDKAWSTLDPCAKAMQRHMFPSGKPSLEEFLSRVADDLKN